MTSAAQTIGESLRDHAELSPDKPFLQCGDATYTYAQMDDVSDQVAAGLADHGIKPQQRLALLVPNRPEMLELYFACAKLGVVQVPLNVFLKGEFLRYQLQDSRAQTLVVDEPGLKAVTPLLSGLPDLERIILLADPPASEPVTVPWIPYRSIGDSDRRPPRHVVEASDLMSILYTSGTTGPPKGCMMAHGYYVHVGHAVGEMLGVDETDVIFTPLPLFHAGARVLVTSAAMVHGATAVLEPSFSASAVWDRIIETGATVFEGTGMMGMAMLSVPESGRDRKHQLRVAALLPFSADLQEQFESRFGCTAWAEFYGQTECVPATYTPIDDPDRLRGSAGIPAPYLDVALLDEHDNKVEAGEVGEIAVRPRRPFVMYQGYWNKPEATVDAWRNLWHHTGDFGRFDTNGVLSFVDRKKDALRRRGENISSMELEAAILRHPDIAECAVHAVPTGATEDEIKACLVLHPHSDLEATKLFEFLKAELPYFAIPRYYEILDELPKNAVQRVMKHRLRVEPITSTTVDFQELGLTVATTERR